MTRRGRLAAACAAAFCSLSWLLARAPEWKVDCQRRPGTSAATCNSHSGKIFRSAVADYARYGFPVEPFLNSMASILRRGAGAAIEYDGQNGEIRYGPVVAGHLQNYKQVTISGPMEEFMFPV